MSITPAAPVTPATTDLNAGVVHGINVGSAANAANFDAFLKHFAQTSANMVNPAGDELLDPSLAQPSADLAQRADRLVRDWQQWVLDLVRAEAGDKRFVARAGAYAVNGVGLTVMIAVFTSTAFIPTGAELAVGAGTTVAAQKVLEAIFGDQAIRTLAAKARDDLLTRVDKLLQVEANRFSARTESVGLVAEPGAELRQAAAAVAATPAAPNPAARKKVRREVLPSDGGLMSPFYPALLGCSRGIRTPLLRIRLPTPAPTR